MFSLMLLFIVCTCLWAIVSPLVATGVLGTLGLTLIACGSLADLDLVPHPGYHLRTIGLVLTCASMLWRYAGQARWNEWSAKHIRRAEDLRAHNRRT